MSWNALQKAGFITKVIALHQIVSISCTSIIIWGITVASVKGPDDSKTYSYVLTNSIPENVGNEKFLVDSNGDIEIKNLLNYDEENDNIIILAFEITEPGTNSKSVVIVQINIVGNKK